MSMYAVFFEKWLHYIAIAPAQVAAFVETHASAKGGELDALLAMAED